MDALFGEEVGDAGGPALQLLIGAVLVVENDRSFVTHGLRAVKEKLVNRKIHKGCHRVIGGFQIPVVILLIHQLYITDGSGGILDQFAKNLTEIQGGNFSVYLDGDLFRVTITFPKLEALPEDMSIGLLEENIEASLTESLAEKTEETSEEM